jgi:signal peptide peptidase SppA
MLQSQKRKAHPMPLEETVINMERPAYSRMGDYFGMWAMDESAFAGLQNLILSTDLSEHMNASKLARLQTRRSEDAAEVQAGPPYQVAPGGIAVIELRGTLMKSEGSFGDSTSTVAARQAVRMSVRDPQVAGILLLIDSPGGTVAGTNDLANEVANASKVKPTAAYIEDMGASAAYWVASQADSVSTGPTGIVGSIGTLHAVRDTSVAAEKSGVKIHVIKAGAHKGAGVPGAEVTEAHLAEFQRRVNDLNSEFVSGALINGRGMTPEQAAVVADGRAHVGQVAKTMGLVDAIESLDQAVAALLERTGNGQRSSSVKGQMEMTVENPAAPKAATLAELKAALPKADAAFTLAQLERGATVADAKSAWSDVVEARLEAKEAK